MDKQSSGILKDALAMFPNEQSGYVRLDDHLAAIAALQKQLTAVTIARHRIMDECNNLTREIDLQWRPKVVALQGQIMDLQQENAALESANEHLNVVNGELTDSLRNGHP